MGMLRLMDMTRGRTWPGATVAVTALALLITGCTGGAGSQAAAPPEPPLRAEAAGRVLQQDPVVPENGTAPQAFLDRERLPSCGSYAWTLNDDGPPENVWRCLADSLDNGDPAELIVQAPGIDSTSVRYLRVLDGGGDIEFWARDTMGDRWWRGECASFDAEDGPGPCEAVETFD